MSRLGSRSNPPEITLFTALRSPWTNACVRSADSAVVVVPHMAVNGNPLRASSPTAGFAPNNRNKVRQAGLHGVLVINSFRLALEAASLQWMEGEKELSKRTVKSLTTTDNKNRSGPITDPLGTLVSCDNTSATCIL